MRTTITLDADVQALVEREMRERQLTFKQTVNEALRRSLSHSTDDSYVVPTANLGARADLDKPLQLIGDLEDDESGRVRWQMPS